MFAAEHRRPFAAFLLVCAAGFLITGFGLRTQVVQVLVDNGAPAALVGVVAPDVILGETLSSKPAPPAEAAPSASAQSPTAPTSPTSRTSRRPPRRRRSPLTLPRLPTAPRSRLFPTIAGRRRRARTPRAVRQWRRSARRSARPRRRRLPPRQRSPPRHRASPRPGSRPRCALSCKRRRRGDGPGARPSRRPPSPRPAQVVVTVSGNGRGHGDGHARKEPRQQGCSGPAHLGTDAAAPRLGAPPWRIPGSFTPRRVTRVAPRLGPRWATDTLAVATRAGPDATEGTPGPGAIRSGRAGRARRRAARPDVG